MSKGFDFNSVKDFDNHIDSSISGYSILTNLILNISSYFIKEDKPPIDLGCTSGLLVKKINEKYNVKSIGYDISSVNFCDYENLIESDISNNQFIVPKTNLAISVFTIQFLDKDTRQKLIDKIYNSLDFGGAFIFCEKEYEEKGIFQDIFQFVNYNNKLNHFTSKEILEKEYQLRFNMRINESKENIRLLENSGFKKIGVFFKSLLFKGYICVK